MDRNFANVTLPLGTPNDDELLLLPVSPALNRRQRAQDLSQLSLRSAGSYFGRISVNACHDIEEGHNEEHPDKLQLASWSGDEAAVESMLNEETVDVNSLDHSGRTALHNAILGCHEKIIVLLLESGADTSILDRSQDAPLHTAVRTGNETLVKALLSVTQSDTNIRGNGSQTALHIAAGLDNLPLCKILIENGASQDCCDDEQMTPLTRAVEKGAFNVAEFFLHEVKENKKHKVKDLFENVDSEGSTLLHLAVDSGSLKTVQLCLDQGAIIRQPKEHDRSTAFHLACAVGALRIVQLFVTKDPTISRITLIDAHGLTPLHLAAMNNHPDVVKYLLDQGASLDSPDNVRRTPLFLAAEMGGTESVKMLIDMGADVTVKDVDLRSCVRVAVGHAATMEVLLQKEQAIPLITDKDITGFAPVHYAAKHGQLQSFMLFMKRNKNTATVTSDGLDTALHGAARYGRLEVVDALLSGRNVRSINVKNSEGKTALHFACAEGHNRVAEHLLKLGAAVESDNNHRTALHLAAMKGSKRCTQYILESHPKCVNLFDKNQNTALHLAAIYGHPEVVSTLLSSEKQDIVMNRKNQNVLDAAMEAQQKDVLLAITSHRRWREVLTSSKPGPMAQMSALAVKYPEVAKRFMDQCVTKEGNPDGEDYKITYDFSLIQGAHKAGEDCLMLLKTMLLHRRLNCLTHPLCFYIMNTKWKTFGFQTLTANLLLYLLFVIPLTVLAIFIRANEKTLCGINETWKRKEYIGIEVPCITTNKLVQTLQYAVAVVTLLHMIKELLQLRKQGRTYLLSLTNYLEWSAYGLTLLYIFPPCDCKLGFKQEIGALALFFGWMNLVLFLRRLSSYGQYVIMLTTMFATLIKVWILFFLFIVAFGSTFYILMDEETLSYSTFPNSMMTVFVMTLGELNYAEVFMPWDKLEYATLTNILFFIFVLGMPIIIMNMLVGLAVGDIDKIQINAVLDRYVMQAELVLEMEEWVPSWLAKRANIGKYVEHPNQKSSKLFDSLFGFSRPGDDEEEHKSSLDHHHVYYSLLERMEEQESRINGIYEVLKQISSVMKTEKANIPSKRVGDIKPGRSHFFPF
ncbi:transient receptor potential cation channel subfamily A member 1-like [Acropora muricata]|uniref:transient receptor potential cation channel subfamily A member 1-like n=1 Tax=Acropora muricata TaxID=159855 RepID=UPI0034E606A2